MIKINLLSTEKQQLNKAVAEALEAIRSRSYSARHPELGKMIKCAICQRRHRENLKCQLTYATRYWTDDTSPMMASQTTIRGVMGAAHFARKRFHPHPNKRGLALVERTQAIFPEEEKLWPTAKEAMKRARTLALRQLKAERRAARKIKTRQQSIARRINFGLAKNGSR